MAEANSETPNPLVGLSRQLAGAVERVGPSVVAVHARPRVPTSGVVWREGVVVSTNHTVRRDDEITVTLHDGRETHATLVGRDPATDLAVLRLAEGDAGAAATGQTATTTGAHSTTPAQTADAATLGVGSLVLAVGRAAPGGGVTASLGIVSHLGGKWRTWRGGEVDRLVRPDVSIFVGFSGGALVDAEGGVVGVNTTGLARGTGLTVPAQTVNRVVEQLLARGRVARPYAGVGMHPVALPGRLRERYNLPKAFGLMILAVEPDGPADRAGLAIGDILLALGGEYVAHVEEVPAALAGCEVGSAVRATILRGGELRELEITLGERPSRKR